MPSWLWSNNLENTASDPNPPAPLQERVEAMSSKPLISSSSNPLVKQVRALHQRKAHAETGLFVVEGLHHVGEAIESGWEIESILYAPNALVSNFANQLISTGDEKLQPVTAEVMEALSDKDNPQGILAVVRQKRSALSELFALNSGVAMVSPQDPGNVGTVLRSADAVGTDALFLADGGVDPYHPTCVRASMGTLFWKPIVQTSFIELVAWSRMRRIQLIGTSAHAESDYRDFKPTRPWILLLGSEQKGLNVDQLQACDAKISMPMRGRGSSLNVAVAAGVLLYQFSA